MLTAIVAVIIFFVLVGVHEFGHFAAAKACGVKVLEFSLGMGPALVKKQGKETLYSLRAIPIGGFCKMEGEEESSDDPRSFSQKKPWQRLIILASGAAMNILLGFVVFIIFFALSTQVTVPVVGSFIENSPAQQVGMEIGDRITKANGTTIHIFNDLKLELMDYHGGEIEIEYERNGEKYTAEITPVKKDEQYLIGFVSSIENLTFTSRIKNAFYYSVFMGKLVYKSLGMLIGGGASVTEVSGPVGIVNEINNATNEGLKSVLHLTGLITINLGIFNLLPLPALDGGHIIFVLIEMIRRKKVPPEKEGVVHGIGFALLFGLMIFATWNDIVRLISG